MKQSIRCQCFDPGCNIHHDGQCKERSTGVLYRVDQEDMSGTRFCVGCADDAFSSGLFSNDDQPEDSESLSSQITLARDEYESLRSDNTRLREALTDATERLEGFIGADCECDNTHKSNNVTCGLCMFRAALAKGGE